MNNKKHSIIILIIALILVISVIITFRYIILENKNKIKNVNNKKRILVINNEINDVFWKDVVKGAKKQAKYEDAVIYVFDNTDDEKMSSLDKVKMGILEDVDGVILCGSSSDEINKLMAEGNKKFIKIIGNSNNAIVLSKALANKYSKEIVKACNQDTGENNIKIIINKNDNRFFNSVSDNIKENLKNKNFNISVINVEGNKSFYPEEKIREMLIKDKPNIVVAFTSNDTFTVYRFITEYDLVDSTKLIGFYHNKNIINGINSGVIKVNIDVNGEEIGKLAVKKVLGNSVKNNIKIDLLEVGKKNEG